MPTVLTEFTSRNIVNTEPGIISLTRLNIKLIPYLYYNVL